MAIKTNTQVVLRFNLKWGNGAPIDLRRHTGARCTLVMPDDTTAAITDLGYDRLTNQIWVRIAGTHNSQIGSYKANLAVMTQNLQMVTTGIVKVYDVAADGEDYKLVTLSLTVTSIDTPVNIGQGYSPKIVNGEWVVFDDSQQAYVPTGQSVVATEYVDEAVAAEAEARQQEISSLESSLASETSRAQAKEAELQGAVEDVKTVLGEEKAFTTNTNKRFAYPFVVGSSYKMSNNSASSWLTIKTATTATGGTLTTLGTLSAGESKTFTISVAASYLVVVVTDTSIDNSVTVALASSISGRIDVLESGVAETEDAIETEEAARIAGDSTLSTRIDALKEITDELITEGTTNLYSSDLNKILLSVTAISASATFQAASHAHCLVIPVSSELGSVVTIERPNTGTMKVATSAVYPAVGVAKIDYAAGTGLKAQIAIASNANYLCFNYWIDNVDSKTEAQLLQDLRIYYGTEWKEPINKVDVLQDEVDKVKGISQSLFRFDFSDVHLEYDAEAIADFNPNEYQGTERQTDVANNLFLDENSERFYRQLYLSFDQLVTDYPNYVSKIDAYTFAEMQYPAYAHIDEDASKALFYETTLYKFIASNANVGNQTQKRKVLIIGGTHAGEISSQYTLYTFVKHLANASLNDVNRLSMRNACDFYILPCLDGYGAIYRSDASKRATNPYLGRCNHNGVNLNRNFPTENWHAVQEYGQEDYSGATAGSEIETQLVVALIDKIKPDMVVDFHGHVATQQHIYSMLHQGKTDRGQSRALYQAVLDITRSWKSAVYGNEHLSDYYGSDASIFMAGPAPATSVNNNGATLGAYGNEAGVQVSTTIECPQTIAFNGGTYGGNWHHHSDRVIFALDEFLLLSQIIHYLQWLSDFDN